MRIKILLFYCLFFVITNGLNAQNTNFENFRGLRSSGSIPEDFTKLSSEKFYTDVKTISATSTSEKNTQERFLLESNFLMDDILQSGRVIFGDTVTNYLNELKNIIFQDDPVTRDNIRIYTLLSNEVNAFTSDNGIVLVTTGLIAQVENEAQIVFILCHEFNHYLEKHAINNYVESYRMERGANIYKSLRGKQVDLEKFRYSKELEMEADELGLELFKKTNYSLEEAEGVFDVMLYSYLPFDEVKFNTTFFDEEFYHFPSQYFTDTVNAITAIENYDDEESTHPNIKKRREAMKLASGKNKAGDRKVFILGEEKFNYIQKLCRYQGCEIYLSNLEYEDAIYQAYLLQQDNTTNQYLKNVISQALYALCIYKNSALWPEGHRYYKMVEGNIQQLYYFIYKIPREELNILALQHAWESHLADPENYMLSKICEQLAYELVNVNNIEINDFFTQNSKPKQLFEDPADSLKSENPSIVINPDPSKSKYEKIKTNTLEIPEETVVVNDYWKYAFIPYMEDANFIGYLDVKNEIPVTAETTVSTKKRNQKPQFNLGLSEIVIVDPQLVRIDERKKVPVLFLEAEKSKLELKDQITEAAEEIDLDVKYLDFSTLQPQDSETFNDLALLNIWIQEKLAHLNKSVDIINSTNDEFNGLSEKYNMDNFAWLGILELREKEENLGLKIFLSFIGPTAPFYLFLVLDPNYYTYFFTLVANANTGKISILYSDTNKHNDVKFSEIRNINYILEQIKK